MRVPSRLAGAIVACAIALTGVPVPAQEPPPGLYIRIFLTDGRTLTSYGEYARLGDRVVFSLPLGGPDATPALHLASIPADQVDWAATDRYRDAARAAHYVATRGDEDFAAISSEVARILNEIALTQDRATQLALAERARRQLAEWPREHYGYRADDVRQILAVLDEVVSELRASGDGDRFALSLVASVTPPPSVPLLAPPTLQESIQQALDAASYAATASDRVSLVQSAVALIDAHGSSLPRTWAETTRREAMRTVAREESLTRAYAGLSSRALADAQRAASRADVRGVERVLRDVKRQDVELGAARPDEVGALLASLQTRLDATRRLRLAQDRWQARRGALRAYRAAVERPFEELGRAHPMLDDIRTLAGPEARHLDRLLARFAGALARLRVLRPPDDLQPVHGILVSALQLAENAVRLRRTAVSTGEVAVAWDASAAAAGAMMLAERARTELARTLAPPQLP